MMTLVKGFRMRLVCLAAAVGTLLVVLVALILTLRATTRPAQEADATIASPQEWQTDEMTEVERKASVEKRPIEKGVVDPRGWHFPKTATEYAEMVEPHLGVPTKIDLSEAVEIPL
jgi:hypothetical protein